MKNINPINIYTNPQPIPAVYNEGFSQYETITKMITLVNDLIENQNLGVNEIDELKNKKMNLEFYLDDIKNKRKLDENGNFTGTWNGYTPSQVDVAITSIINTHTNQISSKLDKSNYAKNILEYGGSYDGVTPNDEAFNTAKNLNLKNDYKGWVYFPNNDIGNAVYYFENAPFMDTTYISADKGVKLSFPSTSSRTFKNVIFKDDIEIISRDRDNTGTQLVNDYSKTLFATLSDNDTEIGMKKPRWMDFSEFSGLGYHADSDTTTTMAFAPYDSSRNIYKIAITDQPNNPLQFNTLEKTFTPGHLYTTLVKSLVPETNVNTRFGVMFTQNGGNFLYYSIDTNGSLYKGVRQGGNWVETSSNKLNGSLTDAYKLRSAILIGIRPITQNVCEIYLNGVLVDTVSVSFNATKIGFALNNITTSGAGVMNVVFGSWTDELVKKTNVGRNINIAGFGDSITCGEGASISWVEYLPKFLEGQRGINKINITNKAVSGHNSSQQLALLNSYDFTNTDICLILVGTNDIQGGVDVNTFKNNLQSMISKATQNGCKVVVGIPPMWISRSLTGIGFDSAQYNNGAEIRATILQLCSTNVNVYIADTLSEVGLINVNSTLNVLRDNLHPNTFGEILLSRCFARSIIYALTNDI